MPNLSSEQARSQAVGSLRLLADVREQWDYQLRVPIANVQAELCEIGEEVLQAMLGVPDAFLPHEALLIDRVSGLIRLYPEKLPNGLIAMQHDPRWLEIMAEAKSALDTIAPSVVLSGPESLATPNPIGTWQEYFASVERSPLHPLYAELDKYLPSSGDAFELACGLGKGALHLVGKGFTVWATDVHGEALSYLYEHTPVELRDRLHLYLSTFETLDLAPNLFDVFVAGFCLFFMSPRTFEEKWPMIAAAVRPGGLFMGQFLGPNDEWAARGYPTQTLAEVEELLGNFQILHMEEVDRDGKTAQGVDKHWHIFHVVARKET